MEFNEVINKRRTSREWMAPCFIGIGYPNPDGFVIPQYDTTPDKHIHMGSW